MKKNTITNLKQLEKILIDNSDLNLFKFDNKTRKNRSILTNGNLVKALTFYKKDNWLNQKRAKQQLYNLRNFLENEKKRSNIELFYGTNEQIYQLVSDKFVPVYHKFE